MNCYPATSTRNYREVYQSLNARWLDLCRQYLPLSPEKSIWRYSREASELDPEQGWKLHISATVLNATRVLRKVGPFLQGRGVMFKAPASLMELSTLNTGIHYGYSQVGKFLTVYPRSSEEAKTVASRLHELTQQIPAPSIPFDKKYAHDGCIFYRYGAFRALAGETEADTHRFFIRDPHGSLIPDLRDSPNSPEWAIDPFASKVAAPNGKKNSPLKTTFRAFRALAQRGKGGVYQILDFSVNPPRLAILKEGRKQGEMAWNGKDGYWRVRHEQRVLTSLRKAGVNVPETYAAFEAEDNYYLAVEFIDGQSLQAYLDSKKRRLPIVTALRCGIELASLVSQIHEAGWVWRDCKPGNIIRTNRGKFRPIDFEGACRLNKPDPYPWGTPLFAAPEWETPIKDRSRQPEDLYALGSVIWLILNGRLPSDPQPNRPRKIPPAVNGIVTQLLDRDWQLRPSAKTVVDLLSAQVQSLTR